MSHSGAVCVWGPPYPAFVVSLARLFIGPVFIIIAFPSGCLLFCGWLLLGGLQPPPFSARVSVLIFFVCDFGAWLID